MLLKNLYQEIENWANGRTEKIFLSQLSEPMNSIIRACCNVPERPEHITLPDVVFNGKYQNVVLMSGGMDSFILYELTKNLDDVLHLFIDVGLGYSERERAAAESICRHLKVYRHSLENVATWKHILPARNLLLIAIAHQYVRAKGKIWLGAVGGEIKTHSGDKSLDFFDAVETLSKQTPAPFTIKTLVERTKNEWMKWYLDKSGGDKAIIEKTVTCYSPTPGETNHCGECQACVRKWIAMKYCELETQHYFSKDPYIGGREFIEKYRRVFTAAIESQDFSEYSRKRPKQDLAVIQEHEKSLNK